MGRFTTDSRPVPIRCSRCGSWYNANNRAQVDEHLNCQIELVQEIELQSVHDLQRGLDQARYLGP